MQDDFAYKCECGRLVKIDDEHEDFFVGHGKGMKRSFLVGTCPECVRNSLFTPDDFGKLYHIYTGATFEFR
jgi:hypothetical protein